MSKAISMQSPPRSSVYRVARFQFLAYKPGRLYLRGGHCFFDGTTHDDHQPVSGDHADASNSDKKRPDFREQSADKTGRRLDANRLQTLDSGCLKIVAPKTSGQLDPLKQAP